jgi:hypothetical protein
MREYGILWGLAPNNIHLSALPVERPWDKKDVETIKKINLRI